MDAAARTARGAALLLLACAMLLAPSAGASIIRRSTSTSSTGRAPVQQTVLPKAKPVDQYPSNVLSFDGTRTGAKSLLNFEVAPPPTPLTQFTISAWVRIREHKSHNMIMVSHERAVGFSMFVDAGEKACLGLFRPEGMKTVSSRALQLPFAWHYIVGTYDGNNSLIYVDGMPGDIDPVPGLSFPKLSFSVAGFTEMPGLRLDGSVARVQMWDHARTAAQIAHDMLMSWTSSHSHLRGLIGSWPINEGHGLLLADKSARGRSGSMFGDFIQIPQWTTSTIPHFATGQSEALVDLGKYRAGGHLEIVNFPTKGTLELWDSFSAKPVGRIPRLPWPLVDGRQLRFVPDQLALTEAASSGQPVCSSFTLRFTKDGAASSHLVELLVGTTNAHRSQFELNKGCRQARAFQGTTSRAADSLPPEPAFSFLLPVSVDFGAWKDALNSVFVQNHTWEAIIAIPKGAREGLSQVLSDLREVPRGNVRVVEMSEGSSTSQLVNQAAEVARAGWLMPMSQQMILSPDFLSDIAAVLEVGSAYTAVAPMEVSGNAEISYPCYDNSAQNFNGRLPDSETLDGLSPGGLPLCSCHEDNVKPLAIAAGAALSLGDKWPVLMPGGMVPVHLWNEAGGWDEDAPLGLYQWDFWMRLENSATAPQASVAQAGRLALANHMPQGSCSWSGNEEAAGRISNTPPSLDQAVALLRLRHSTLFGEESLNEAQHVASLQDDLWQPLLTFEGAKQHLANSTARPDFTRTMANQLLSTDAS